MTRAARSATFYALVSLGLVTLVTKAHREVLPAGLAAQIGHNSEALLFALLVCAQIQLLSRVSMPAAKLATVGAGAVVLVGLGTVLLHSDLGPTLVTLNEPMIGAGFVLVYLALPRSPVVGVGVFVAVALFVVVFFDTGFVLDQAESLVPLALAGLALDVFDRTILQPERVDAPLLRICWMLLLVITAVGLMRAADWAREDLHGGLRYTVDYLQRAAEAYWGWLLIHAYFSYWLGSRWRGPLTEQFEPCREPSAGSAA